MGRVYYGMHFYPGVAEYQEGADAYRVLLNEDTIRAMDPSFAGRPIFVEHVEEVEQSLDKLRGEADGWVMESFYNAADGKHWVKFIVVSERGERAVQSGMRLSNAYIPKSFGQGGLWNGVSYTKEITGGEYEHLAIVTNPRYEESVIMNPDEFKSYNEQKQLELKKLSNSKREGESKMKLNFFKRSKVENAIDPDTCVVLPKSGKEKTLTQIVNDADEMAMMDGMADVAGKVKLHDGSMCNVGELVEKHKAMCDELEGLKGKKEDEMEKEEDVEVKASPVDVEGDKKNADEEAAEMAKKKEADEAKEAKKQNDLEAKAAAKAKADKVRNAHLSEKTPPVAVELSMDRVARGKAFYGSDKTE